MNTSTFHGKVAFVTGGASGIGLELCRTLAHRGAVVIIADRDGNGTVRAAAEISGRNGAKAEGLQLDVTSADAFQDTAHDVIARHGRIDYLFNNAGINVIGDALDTTLDDWNRVIDVNLRGVVHGITAVYPLMARRGSGHIVNTASAQGLGPAPWATAYTATKFAVVGLSLSLRQEAASRGVRVSCACPGFVNTPIRDNARYAGITRGDFEKGSLFKPMSASECAEVILKGVGKNRGIIPVSAETHLLWWAYRLAPELLVDLMAKVYEKRLRP